MLCPCLFSEVAILHFAPKISSFFSDLVCKGYIDLCYSR